MVVVVVGAGILDLYPLSEFPLLEFVGFGGQCAEMRKHHAEFDPRQIELVPSIIVLPLTKLAA